ncbi:uncharacterized protein VICG_00151 [Vittaforma corneae ATCC 50505]|uniref:NEDD8-activating enzyme E1 catalytic subunit n=1 Tax=Vittaforma corneae (strain ATCC 50505) TaxID=993615 RepID=L2GPR9_VITCO|nr:uncharacterized protein VICG_00151 [Vittaforma corneae ATCC 50505]ELA42836.1 hypothetical protein VICG_00151 [Vittaforma corneae ATCC 50505]
MSNPNVLIVGSGGLGSEVVKILKILKCSVTVIDYDTIETSNLNRQFYFQKEDAGKFKAKVVAEKTNSKYIIGKIEDTSSSFLGSFDVIFSCLDSVSSRMQMNYSFSHSKCKMMVDCGVEGLKAHAKRVTRATSCLYCIRDFYSDENAPFICSLKKLNQKITAENRNQVLKSIIFQKKEQIHVENNHSDPKYEEIYEEIVDRFNLNASDDLKTSLFEVKGMFENIIPNVCTINSICANLAVLLAFNAIKDDFVYFDGSSGIFTNAIEIEKDPTCFVCNLQH